MRTLYAGLAFCLSLPAAGQAQAVPTSREARPTLERSTIMTLLRVLLALSLFLRTRFLLMGPLRC